MRRYAFTMIELIFVIVILGILSAVAIPRLGSTVNDANIAKGRSDVSAIRSAIVSERQGRLLQGNSSYINQLDDSTNYNAAGEILFDSNGTATNVLLQYGITSATGDGHWLKTGANAYTYTVSGDPVAFAYTQGTGRFDCNHSKNNCKLLTE
jgi:general secretion pathway protein G